MLSLNLIASAMAIAVLGPATNVAAGYVCKEYEIGAHIYIGILVFITY